jgi:V8-like Glu-specific endopeptidase
MRDDERFPRNSSENTRSAMRRGPTGWIDSAWIARTAWVASAFAIAALAAGCASADGSVAEAAGEEHLGSASAAIYGGVADDDKTGSPGVVAVRIDGFGSFELCSGALIAPNVVLTALHCLTAPLTSKVVCDEKGASGNGSQVGADFTASTIHVFTGAKPDLVNGTPAANGKQIIHPQTSILCNADIALIVLDTKIKSVAPLAVRLAAVTPVGENVRTVGYGENDKGLPIGTRLRKEHVPVLGVGEGVSDSGTALASHELELGLSICQGDSGGPAISESTGAVIGVVSRGGSCNADKGHIYTQTNGFASLIARAFSVAGGAPIAETGAPSAASSGQRGKSFGDACASNDECKSAVCVAQGDAQFCSEPCGDDAECPSSYACSELMNSGADRVCASSAVDALVRSVDPLSGGTTRTTSNLRAGANDGGCAVGPAGGGASKGGEALALVAAFATALGARRRRRAV